MAKKTNYIIDQLITKFFYRNNQLFFQILLNTDNSTTTYGEYTDYSTYKKVYNQLLGCKNSGKQVSLPNNGTSISQIILP